MISVAGVFDLYVDFQREMNRTRTLRGPLANDVCSKRPADTVAFDG